MENYTKNSDSINDYDVSEILPPKRKNSLLKEQR